MNRDVDVVVVGAGVMGLATAHALGREGHDVLVLEQFRRGHNRGSSHGATRIFRLAYTEPEWVRLAQEALRGWRELEAERGTELLSLVGLVELVRDLTESSQQALASCGVDCRVLDAVEVLQRFHLFVPDGFAALFQPDAGIVHAERALDAFAAGVTVREETNVVGVAEEEEFARIESDGGAVKAGAIVVTAGPWAPRLLATAGIELHVAPARETVAYFELEAEELPPAVAEFQTEARRHAFYALHDPMHGLKAGLNGSGTTADPDAAGAPDAEVVARVADWVAERFPVKNPEPVRAETCFYTNTEDESFVLERHGRIVVGSACSGHGFKFAPVVGRRLAALAVEALT